jgi:hypothetical protein
MAVALAFAALIALAAFAFFLMWGMPSIYRGHHEDNGPDVGGGPVDGGGHGDGGGGSH